jgi:putative hemolysin
VTPTAWAGLTLLILANTLYVAAEFGAVGVRRSRVRRLADDGGWLAARLLPHVDPPAALDRYVGASQIGITLSSLMLGALAQATVGVALAPVVATAFNIDPITAQSAASIAVLLVLTAAQLVIGELVPKAIALQYPTETALATVLPMQVSLRLFAPLLSVLNGSANLLLRLIGTRPSGHGHLHSPEEIELMIAESRDGGLLEPEEQQRLHRALKLGLRHARDLMVPVDRLTMIEELAPWEDVLRTVSVSAFSRLPVYRRDRTRIVGMLRVKDLVDQYIAEGPMPLARMMRPIGRVSADAPADRVIALLREQRAHLAVVTDTAGRALGIVTIQDLLSALLGSETKAASA